MTIFGDDLSGDKPRLEFLRDKVDESKKTLKCWEDLVTHEICLMNGMHYKIKSITDEQEKDK